MSTNGSQQTDLIHTVVDYETLIQLNPGLKTTLANIVLARMLREKDAEIEQLRQETAEPVY